MKPLVRVAGLAASVLLASPSRAEQLPQVEWFVIGDAVQKTAPVVIARGGEVSLGEVGGWRCYARVDTETRAKDGKHADNASVRCASATAGVRTHAQQVDGEPLGEGAVLQVTNAAGDKPVRTLIIAPRLKP